MSYQGKFVQDGRNIDYTPDAAVSAGDVVVQDGVVGIANMDIAADALGALSIAGVFDVVKAEEAFATLGAPVYWDENGSPYGGVALSGCATATATGNTYMGAVLVAAEDTDATVRVVLKNTVTLSAEGFALTDLSDIEGATAYAAGSLLVADGDSYEEAAITGPLTLSGAGLISLASATVVAAGSAQGDATAVADGFTMVSAADGAKGVKLPTAAAGGWCVIKNAAASALLLYPNTSDAIDALGANNAMTVPPQTEVMLVAYDATTWYSSKQSLADLEDVGATDYTAGDLLVGSGTAYAEVPVSGAFALAASGALNLASATVAAAGSDQTNAGAVAEGFTLVTAADATKGVILPTAAAGKMCIIKNANAAVLKIYPGAADTINGLTHTTGSLDIAASTSVILVAYDATDWYSIPLLPS